MRLKQHDFILRNSAIHSKDKTLINLCTYGIRIFTVYTQSDHNEIKVEINDKVLGNKTNLLENLR